jgi:hypothetical protein
MKLLCSFVAIMNMKLLRNTLALNFILLLIVSNALSQEKPGLREVDRIRIAEAFRLSEKLGDELWAGWSKAPLAILLVIPEKEFLQERSTLKLEDYKRVAFYPLGAGEGLLLDRANPNWPGRYFAEKFDNEKYFSCR